MVASIRQDIPEGKFRVISIKSSDCKAVLIRDCDSQEEAYTLADDYNRNCTGSDEVYMVYDDQGKYLRGEEAVRGKANRRQPMSLPSA